MRAMTRFGVNAAALGNHEFDKGAVQFSRGGCGTTASPHNAACTEQALAHSPLASSDEAT